MSAYAETIRTSIPVAAIPAYFNCDQTAAQMLVADGYATRIGADAKMFGKTSNTVKRVSTASLDAFLGNLLALSRPSLDPDAQPMTLSAAAYELLWPVGRIVRLILSGKLVGVVQAKGQTGFNAILIDSQELRRILFAPTTHAATRSTKAAAGLGIDVGEMAPLLRAANPDGTPVLQRVFARKGIRTGPWSVGTEAFAEFCAAHVSLDRLAEDRGLPAADLRRDLTARGIDSILSDCPCDWGLYRRSDL